MSLLVVCDTNVLVSALIAEGPPSRVLEAAIDGRIELAVPSLVAAELERVLVRKLGFGDASVLAVRRLLQALISAPATEPEMVEAVTGDPSDDAILAYATECAADVLVTGDKKHLLRLGSHGGVRIRTPQALLAEIAAS